MKIEISYVRFFEPLEKSPEVLEILAHAVRQKLPLKLSIHETGVLLCTGHVKELNKGIKVAGRWRSQVLAGYSPSVGAHLVLPFVFLINELHFSPEMLFTFGRPTRSVADLFMRNYFYSSCRGEQIFVQAETGKTDATVTKASRDLSRTYLWIVKAFIKDKILERSNVSELILASAHLPTVHFTSPLLGSGVKNFHPSSDSMEYCQSASELKNAFLHARTGMLLTYKEI
jgi:hypothetical protein